MLFMGSERFTRRICLLGEGSDSTKWEVRWKWGEWFFKAGLDSDLEPLAESIPVG